MFERVLAHKEKRAADRDVREQKSWDDAQAQKAAFDQQKAAELRELVARQTAARKERTAERAERYAQIEAARNAEIQLLIDESNMEDQPPTEEDDEAVVVMMMSRDWPMNPKGTYPRNDALREATGQVVRGKRKRRLYNEAMRRKGTDGNS